MKALLIALCAFMCMISPALAQVIVPVGQAQLLPNTVTLSGWTTSAGAGTATGTTAPDGTASSLIQDTSTSTNQRAVFKQGPPIVAGGTYTASAYFKFKDYTTASLFFLDTGFTNGVSLSVNIQTCTSLGGAAQGTGALVASSVAPAANGWCFATITGIVNGGATQAAWAAYLNGSASYAGVVGQGMYMWCPMLQPGRSASLGCVQNNSPNAISSGSWKLNY